jgi:hypothetical protein
MAGKRVATLVASASLLLALIPASVAATPSGALTGSAASYSVSGGGGNDAIVRGTGQDTLFVSDGLDSVSSGTGDDALSGRGMDPIPSGLGNDSCASDAVDSPLDAGTVDTSAPTVSFPASNSTEIQAGTTAVFCWVASDPSGVALTWGQAGGPPGWVDWCGFATPAPLVSGTAEVGTYELRCAIPATAVNERYTLYVGSADALGNSSPNWASFDFTIVNGSSDNLVPQINAVRLPATVSVGQTFTVDIDLTDESGTAGVYSWFRGETPNFFYDQNGQYIPALDSAVLDSGDATNGTFRQTLMVSSWTPPGRYSLLVSIRDTVGNRGFMTTEYFVTVTPQAENVTQAEKSIAVTP